jgi:phospholipid transport system substrate-binding protein
MKRWLIALLLVVILAIPCLSFADAALDTVKANADAVLAVMRDPKLQGEQGLKVKEQRIEAVADKLFDWVELSKRTLGLDWNKFTMDQRKEFVQLFKSLLRDTYVNNIAEYTNEQVKFTKEVPLSDKTAEVQSVVITKNGEIPINYRVINEGSEWKVYDVVIEGVSLVSNYRTQFREILGNNPPEKLLETLRQKPSMRAPQAEKK